MAHWNTDQVYQWLNENGFEKYSRTFRNEDIDGMALVELREREIFQLLTLIDVNGIQRYPSKQLLGQFRKKHEELKKWNGTRPRKASPSPSSATNPTDQKSKTLILKSSDPKLKFFQSPWLFARLAKDISRKFQVQLTIPSIIHPEMKKEFPVQLLGKKETLRSALEYIQSFFSSVKQHIFNDENLDKKILKCSRRIYSDSALSVLQRIFLEKKKFTIWEKTNVISGAFRVSYLHGDGECQTSVDFLRHVLTLEMGMSKDLTLPNLSSMPKKGRDEIDEFLRMKSNQPTMTIISVQCPSQKESPIILFGLKSAIRPAKNRLINLIDRYQMKLVRLDLNASQRDFLMHHCPEKLKKTELDYQLNHVKVSIRENSLSAPKYLIRTIRDAIHSLIDHTVVFTYQYLPDAWKCTEKVRSELKSLAQSYRCDLKDLTLETKDQSLILAQKSSGKKSSSKYLKKESNRFVSSIPRTKTISIASHAIEIRRSAHLTFDLEIISAVEDAQREQVPTIDQNLYLESKEGRRVLFIQWSPPSSSDDQSIRSIQKFFSLSLNQVLDNGPETVKTIRYWTNGWETSPCRAQFLPSLMTTLEMKRFSHRSWRIFLICDQSQNELFDSFLQIRSDGDHQEILHPISTMTISLKGTDTKDLHRCQKKIEDFIEENVLRAVRIPCAFSSDAWNQSMINVFYKFCLDHRVLPRWNTDLELIGTTNGVEKAKEKYRWLTQISQLRPQSRVKVLQAKQVNLLLSCSSQDQQRSMSLAHRLVEEEFLVAIDYSDQRRLSLIADVGQTDLILICFSWNYFNNFNCKTVLDMIKSSTKKFIPILFPPAAGDNCWLETMMVEDAFYQTFQKQIRFRLNDNVDSLLGELLRYTKPGTVGRTYPLEDLICNETVIEQETVLPLPDKKKEINEEERRRIHEQQVTKIRQKQQIPSDEIEQLIAELQEVLKNTSDQSDEDEKQSTSNESAKSESKYLQAFFEKVQRWIDQASNGSMIRGNLPPFTLTGDWNDAPFPMGSANKEPWWDAERDLEPFDHSFEPTDLNVMTDTWSCTDESHEYYERLMDRDRPYYLKMIEEKEENDEEETEKDLKMEQKRRLVFYRPLNTYIKRGTVAWNFQYKPDVIKEYHRRMAKGLPPPAKRSDRSSSLWLRLFEEHVRWYFQWKNGELSLESDLIEGRLGLEQRNRAEKQQLEELDRPDNERWIRILAKKTNSKDPSRPCLKKFIEEKIRNLNKLKQFYSGEK